MTQLQERPASTSIIPSPVIADHEWQLRASPQRRRPKLLIAVGMGWGVRNYLLSRTLSELKRDFDIVLLSPFAEFESFREQFTQPDVKVISAAPALPDSSLLAKLEVLTLATFFQSCPTANRKHKFAMLTDHKELSFRKTPMKTLWRRVLQTTGSASRWCYPSLRAMYRTGLKRSWAHVKDYRELLKKEQIDGVFCTNSNSVWESSLALAAECERRPVITAITSWDKPTTKQFPLSNSTGYLAWSPLMKEELQTFMKIKEASRVQITGAPQFDFYFDPNYHQTRQEFCAQHELDPQRKIVVYTTVTPTLMPDEPQVLARVHDWWKAHSCDAQLLVRLHPKDHLERYAELQNDPERTGITWTLAGEPKRTEHDQWCPADDDMIRAVNTLRHGDVNVQAGYSTMMLDFAALDKPVVLLRCNSEEKREHSKLWESYEHLRPVLESHAIWMGSTFAEGAALLHRALSDPAAKREQRRALVSRLLGTVDGNSGVRVARAVKQAVLTESLSSPK